MTSYSSLFCLFFTKLTVNKCSVKNRTLTGVVSVGSGQTVNCATTTARDEIKFVVQIFDRLSSCDKFLPISCFIYNHFIRRRMHTVQGLCCEASYLLLNVNIINKLTLLKLVKGFSFMHDCLLMDIQNVKNRGLINFS